MKRIVLHTACLLILISSVSAQNGGELHLNLHSEPKTFNPLLVADDASETIRYLTGGVLIRVNRQTQELQPELAQSWNVSKDGKSITFIVRDHLYFSDGTPFSAEDVAYTMRQLMDPTLHSPTGDAFRSSPGIIRTSIVTSKQVTITFPAPVGGLERLFDQVAIMSSRSPNREKVVLGPFYLADYKPGAYILLNRNPNYWKTDEAGHHLPYLSAVRLSIQPNRDIEVLEFERRNIDLINSLDSQYYNRLATGRYWVLHDAGSSLDSEQMWFNQVGAAPIPVYKRAWFRSINFRRAISYAINRDDLCRVVYELHAHPAVGPVSPANKFWFNVKLRPYPHDLAVARHLLEEEGFYWQHSSLRDHDGHPVEFSIITNSGNKQREQMAAMIQQDLGDLGITVRVVTLDFPSLIDRITQSFNYEAALLGLVNDDLDPNSQMNVWLSSADNHQWNPRQKSPETTWEARVDKLMRAQASTIDASTRKAAFDEVQEIVWQQLPFIYLVNKDALSVVSESVSNANPVVLRPQTYWNIERMSVAVKTASVH
jgi:peptide/nickel transport system substrate-binding protein